MSTLFEYLVAENCTYHLDPSTDSTNNSNQTFFIADCVEDTWNDLYEGGVLNTLEEWESIPFSITYALITILGLLGNGLVVFAVLRKAEMRTNRNVFITNLALSNFLLALLVYNFLWVPAKNYKFPHGIFLCRFANAFPGCNLYCSTLTISIMAIDRYYLIRRTVLGDSTRRKITGIVLAVCIWIVSLILSLPIFMSYSISIFPPQLQDLPIGDGKTQTFGSPICGYHPPSNIFRLSIIIEIIIFIYVIPLVVLGIFNLKLTRYLEQQAHGSLISSRTPRAKSLTVADNNSGIIYKFRDTNWVNQANGAGAGKALKASEQRRSRTTHLMIAMAASYQVLWLPYTIAFILMESEVIKADDPRSIRFDFAAKLISMLSICVNPFLYGWLNTNFNREFKEIFAQLPCYKWYLKAHPELQIREKQTVELTIYNSETQAKINSVTHRYGSTVAATAELEPFVRPRSRTDCAAELKGTDSLEPANRPVPRRGGSLAVDHIDGPKGNTVSLVIANDMAMSDKMYCDVMLHSDHEAAAL